MPDGKVQVIVDIVAPNAASKATSALGSISKEAEKINKATQAQQKQTEKVIKESVKSIVDYDLKEEKRREREKKAIADRFIATVKQMERESKSAATNSGSAWSSAFGGALAGGAVGAGIGSILSGLRSIGSYATEAGTKLFDMAKEASDFGKQLGSMQTVTGLSAKTLSAFNLAASLTHKELSDLQRPLGFFVHNIGLAAEGNEKAAATMKALGVTDFKNLEQSLSQVLKRIYDLPKGTQQMNAAMDGFSRRGGLDMIKIADKMGGSLEGAKKHADELGVSLTEKDIQAARDFGKAYDVLSEQIKVGVAKFALAYAPQITDAIEGIIKWLGKTQDQWGILGTEVSRDIGEIITGIDKMSNSLGTNQTGWENWGTKVGSVVRQVFLQIEKEMNDLAAMGDILGTLNPFSNETWDNLPDKLHNRTVESTRIEIELQRLKEGKLGAPGSILGGEVPDYTPHPEWFKKTKTPAEDYLESLAESGGGGGGGGGHSTKAKKPKNQLPAFGSMSTLVISSGNAQWDSWFVEMGHKFGVDPNILLLQSGAESSHNKNATSPKGAQGFSQFMPGTAARFHVDTSSIKDSIRGQAQYMGVLLSMFGGDYSKALAGYNAGEGAVQKYHGIPPFAETRGYVSKITSAYGRQVTHKEAGGYGTYDPERAAGEASDLATAADKEKFYRGLIEIYKLTGILPTGDTLDEIHKLMVDDAKKAGKSTFGMTPERTAAGFSLPSGQIPANTTDIYTGGVTFRSDAENRTKLNEVLKDLDETQFNLNEHTEEEILLRKIQLNEYPELTEESKQFVLAKAKEIDATKAQQKADEEAKDAAQKYADAQQRALEQTEDFFRNKLDTLIHGGPKSLWKSLLEDFKNQFIDKAANMLAQMFRGANPGQINGQNPSGPGWSGLFGNIFGGGGGGTGPLGGPDVNNPYILHAAGDGNIGIGGVRGGADVPGLPGGSAGGGFGGLRSLFAPQKNPFTGQMNGKLAGAMGGIGSIAAMVGGFVPGRLGKALQYGGMGAQIGSLFGPWGAAIGAGVGTLFGLFGHHDDGIKKLKQAAAADFGINVSDKTTLKALNAVGEAMFGKGKVGPNADAVVRSEQGMNILRAYATSTGQSGLKIDRLNYGDPNWSGNDFRSSFGGFRAMGGSVRPGYSYIVGERGREMFTPTTGGTITPTASTTDMAKMMGELMRTLDGVQEAVAGLQGHSLKVMLVESRTSKNIPMPQLMLTNTHITMIILG
jgi:hypothetical protein